MQRTISKYVLLEQVGSTGLATVYRAQDPNQQGFVALKVLRPYVCENEELMERFAREMQRVTVLSHPNIVPSYGYERDGNIHWVAMQYVSWPTLRQWMQHPIPVAQAMTILRQVAAAVEAAHAEGIHHGDIRPGNIFVDPETGQALLSDFGMVLLGEGAPAGVRLSLNTPLPTYTAPEMGQSSPPSLSSDVYSLGVLAFDMLTGTVPFSALERGAVQARQLTSFPPLPSNVNPNIPKQLDAVILRALASHPERRYETPGEFVAAMAAASPTTETENVPFDVFVEVERQRELPGIEGLETVSVPREEGPRIMCMVCGHSNSPGSVWCLGCWGVLNRVAAMPGQEVATTEERAASRRKFLRLRRSLVGAAVAAVTTVMLIQYLNITLPLPSPASDISAVSGPGEWAMAYRTTEGPSPVPGESAAIEGQVKWVFETDSPIESTPALKDGRLYVTTQDNRVVALNAIDGSIVWEHPTVAPLDSSPAVAGGMVFLGLRNKRVLALDAETGAMRWEFVTNGNPTTGSPLVKDGVVYIGSNDGHIYALDALTGEERWSHETLDWIDNTPALSGDRLVVSSFDGQVTIYDTDTGKRRFSFRGFNRLVMASPVIMEDTAYVAYRNGLVTAVNLHEEEVLFYSRWYRLQLQLWLWGMIDHPGLPKGVDWVYRTGAVIENTPAVDASTIYVPVEGGKLIAIDRVEGTRVWIYNSDTDKLSTPTLVGDTILLSDSKGALHAINKTTGQEQWSMQIAESITSTPVMAGGTLYLASKDGNLYAVE